MRRLSAITPVVLLQPATSPSYLGPRHKSSHLIFSSNPPKPNHSAVQHFQAWWRGLMGPVIKVYFKDTHPMFPTGRCPGTWKTWRLETSLSFSAQSGCQSTRVKESLPSVQTRNSSSLSRGEVYSHDHERNKHHFDAMSNPRRHEGLGWPHCAPTALCWSEQEGHFAAAGS